MKKEWRHQTLSERPPEVQPRERLATYGPGQLSDAELLAILVRIGRQGVTAIELGEELISHFGGLSGLSRVRYEDLNRYKGMGPAKSAQLTAAIELAKRLTQHLQTGELKLQIKSSLDAIAQFTPYLRAQTQEFFYALLLNTKLRPIKAPVMVTKGGLDKTIAQPREAYQEAVRCGAMGVVFAHNHPSGDPTPSPDDIEVTRRLEEAGKILGIKMLDHLIITDSRFYSFKHGGQE